MQSLSVDPNHMSSRSEVSADFGKVIQSQASSGALLAKENFIFSQSNSFLGQFYLLCLSLLSSYDFFLISSNSQQHIARWLPLSSQWSGQSLGEKAPLQSFWKAWPLCQEAWFTKPKRMISNLKWQKNLPHWILDLLRTHCPFLVYYFSLLG